MVLPDPADAAAWLGPLQEHQIDLLVLAGYLRAGSRAGGRGVSRAASSTPTLPCFPAFGGKGMYGERVHQAVLASGARETGVTIHLVDEVYDRGEVLAQRRVPVLPGDTPERLAARVLEAEHRFYLPQYLRRRGRTTGSIEAVWSPCRAL